VQIFQLSRVICALQSWTAGFSTIFAGAIRLRRASWNLPEGMRTRRWFYFVPAKGTPKKLVHKIEAQSLAALPGETLYYAGQDELRRNVGKILGARKNVAMQYSPKNAIPYVAMVDAGTIELVRSSGCEGDELGRPGAEIRGVLER